MHSTKRNEQPQETDQTARPALAGLYRASLVTPVFNEEQRLASTLARLHEYVTGCRPGSEVLLVLDGCTDGSAEVARRFQEIHGAEYLTIIETSGNRGKGAAVRLGVERAQGSVIGFTDADLPYGTEGVDRALQCFETGEPPDVVIGCRDLPESAFNVRAPLRRRAAGRLYSWLVRATVRPGVSDTQCGLKFFRAPIAKEIFSRVTIPAFGFDVEVMYMARRNGLCVRRIPVRLVNNHDTSVRLVRDSLTMFGDLWRIRANARAGRYDFAAAPRPHGAGEEPTRTHGVKAL